MIDVDNTKPEDYHHDQEPDYDDYADVSDCCGARITGGICSDCHEHCGIEGEDEESPQDMNNRLRSMGF